MVHSRAQRYQDLSGGFFKVRENSAALGFYLSRKSQQQTKLISAFISSKLFFFIIAMTTYHFTPLQTFQESFKSP